MRHNLRVQPAKQYSASAERNREPILQVLKEVLPKTGLVLEVASGTGQHVAFFAASLPTLQWQPSDVTTANFESIQAWITSAGATNALAPVKLDVRETPWAIQPAAIYCANMIHITPFAVSEGLFRGAGLALAAGKPLITYGPYKIGGRHTAPSNAAFDERLRSTDAGWGVRDLGELEGLAIRAGLLLERHISMPANNFCIVWRKN